MASRLRRPCRGGKLSRISIFSFVLRNGWHPPVRGNLARQRSKGHRTGAYLRETDPQVNATRAVRAMQEQRAKSRGMGLREYQDQFTSRQPNIDTSDEYVTPESNQRRTLQAFGSDVTPAMEATRTANRKDAIANMRAARGQDPEVQISRRRGDNRYPDRQTG
jgi:hypothetical protein